MHAKDVQGIVIAQFSFQPHHGIEAAEACEQAEDQGAARQDKARRWGNGDQARDGARGDAQDRGFATGQPFCKHPGQGGGRGRDLRDRHGHARSVVGGQFRTGVEAEPADP